MVSVVSRRLAGLGVSAGEAIGPVARIAPAPALPVEADLVSDPEAEAARAHDALAAVAAELERRAGIVSGAARDVLSAQAMIALDPALLGGVTARIEARRGAPHAVDEAFTEHRGMLESLGGYFAERAADLNDLRDRAAASLLGLPVPGVPDPGHA